MSNSDNKSIKLGYLPVIPWPIALSIAIFCTSICLAVVFSQAIPEYFGLICVTGVIFVIYMVVSLLAFLATSKYFSIVKILQILLFSLIGINLDGIIPEYLPAVFPSASSINGLIIIFIIVIFDFVIQILYKRTTNSPPN